MAFAPDRSLSYVRIEEPNLIAIHRSAGKVVPGNGLAKGHLCEAFVLASKEKNTYRVYAALYDTQLKSSLIFVPDQGHDSKRDSDSLIDEAIAFLDDLGFCMEPVNIRFSPAIREVIMRDIKVMRPPKKVAVAPKPVPAETEQQQEKTASPVHPPSKERSHKHAERRGKTPDTPPPDATPVATVETVPVPVAKTDPVPVTPAANSDVTGEGDGTNSLLLELQLLKSELAAVRKEAGSQFRTQESVVTALENENRALREELAQLSGSQDATVAALAADARALRDEVHQNDRELANERSKNAELSESAQTTAKEVSTLQDELHHTGRELAAERSKNAELSKSAQTAAKKIATLRDELHRTGSELATERSNSAGLSESAQAAAKEVAALREELHQVGRELADERSKNADLSDSSLTTAKEVEALRAALKTADESLRGERAKNMSALNEMEALEQNAAAELKSLNQKVESLRAEKRLLESIASEMKIKAASEIERLQQLNQSQRKAAIQKISTLKEEMRQLAEARAVMSSPFAVVPAMSNEWQVPGETGFTEKARGSDNGAVTLSSFSSTDPFGCAPCEEEICFEPDTGLAGVPYGATADVVEVYRSFNKIHAAPTGKTVQACEGFVCLVAHGGQESIYAAWFMSETGQVLVCRPNVAPDSSVTHSQLLREGIAYFERVGFMMDHLQLEVDPEQRQDQLDSLAVFQRMAEECAA